MTVQKSQTYYTGQGITADVLDDKLERIRTCDITTMTQLVKSIEALQELHKALLKAGVK